MIIFLPYLWLLFIPHHHYNLTSLSTFTLVPNIIMMIVMMIIHVHLRRLLLLLLSLHLPSPNTQEEDINTQTKDQESQEKEDEVVDSYHHHQDFKIRVYLISLYFFVWIGSWSSSSSYVCIFIHVCVRDPKGESSVSVRSFAASKRSSSWKSPNQVCFYYLFFLFLCFFFFWLPFVFLFASFFLSSAYLFFRSVFWFDWFRFMNLHVWSLYIPIYVLLPNSTQEFISHTWWLFIWKILSCYCLDRWNLIR